MSVALCELPRTCSASRFIIESGDTIAPRFEIFTPTGQFNVTIEMTTDENLWAQRLNIVRDFMILKAATGFTLACEITATKVLAVVAVTRSESRAALQNYKRKPISFADIRWVEASPEIVSLLPPKMIAMTIEEIARIENAFETHDLSGVTWHADQ